MEYIWPPDYPKNCPTNPQKEMPGVYYRMILRSNEIRLKDFNSRYIKNGIDNTCSNRSISIFSDIEDAKNVLYQSPRFYYRYIVKLELVGNHGIIHYTPYNNNSHHDWWIPENVNPLEYCHEIQGPF
jgi:hypothetical protein